MLRLTTREEAEDSVAALSSKVEALVRRKEKLEAALAQVGPVHVAIVSCSPFIFSLSFWSRCYSSAITQLMNNRTQNKKQHFYHPG